MKVLLVAPHFYEYETSLIEALRSLGATVTYVENKPFRSDPLFKKSKWYLRLFCSKGRYMRRNIRPITMRKYDICLFVNLFSFEPAIVENLRQQNPAIKCILYLWDSLSLYRWDQFFVHFDRVCTFDRHDALKYDLCYLPNFYVIPETGTTQDTVEYDLIFIGSMQLVRFEMLTKLAEELGKDKRKFLFYLYVHPAYDKLRFNRYVNFIATLFPNYFKRYRKYCGLLTGNVAHEFVKREPLTVEEVTQLIAKSKIVLDLPLPDQVGCTQRLIQALSLQKKVITTNTFVKEESFYDPSFIEIMPADKISIDWVWADKEHHIVDVSYLRLNNWVKTLMQL